jgi:hypothetical protein
VQVPRTSDIGESIIAAAFAAAAGDEEASAGTAACRGWRC